MENEINEFMVNTTEIAKFGQWLEEEVYLFNEDPYLKEEVFQNAWKLTYLMGKEAN